MAEKQFMLYVDTKRCMGCRACETVCKLEHDLPAGPRYNIVTEVESGDGLDEQLHFLPTRCHHCEDAPCAKVCPTGAVYKREDGIVLVDQKKCVGCRKCLSACPFGIPQFGSNGLMQKCNMCYNRIDEGEKPACVANCPAEALLCGTREEISEILQKRYFDTI